MRRSILIHASHWGTAYPTGVELYVDSLFPLLLPLLVKRGFSRVTLLSPQEQPSQALPAGVSWQYAPAEKAWGQRVVRRWQKSLRPSLYFTPSGIPPLLGLVPQVLTIHDLSVYHVPQAYSLGQRIRLRTLLKRVAKEAVAICVPSHYVAAELEKRWQLPLKRICVTPLAVPSQDTSAEVVPQWLKRTSYTRYILYVGRLEFKKNLTSVIEAFGLLDHPTTYLVLAGSNGVGVEKVRAAIVSLPPDIQKRILLPGYVSAPEKRWLFGHADLCVSPSPYEGFGLPVLEAFAAHVPVACADSGAVAEVAAQAAILVPAFDVIAWQSALVRGLDNRAERTRLRYAGIEQLSHYNWRQTAELTAEALANSLKPL